MKLKWKLGIATAGVVYVLAPFVAGALEIGERRGPVFYPEGFHTTLFIMGCEMFNDEKPRQRLSSIFYQRSLFYGLPERPYPKERRLQIIEEMKQRGMNGRMLEHYIELEAIITERGDAARRTGPVGK